MRTTIDLPDSLMTRVKQRIHDDRMTFRALVISALEQALETKPAPFHLRDAAVGDAKGEAVSSQEINEIIDQQRESRFQS